jgi:hypothetical protein
MYLNDTPIAFNGSNMVTPPADGSPIDIVRTFNTNTFANAKNAYKIKVVASLVENPALSSQVISNNPFTIDNGLPVITIPIGEQSPVLEQTSPAGAPFTFHPTVTDSLDPAPTLTVTPSLTVYPPGITPVIFTARDWAGNQGVVNVNVTVLDTTPPSVTPPPDVTVSTNVGQAYASPVILGTPSVTDNSGNANTTNNAPSQYLLGVTIVTWTATDSSGNSATAIQKVTVIDTESPVIIGAATAPPNANGWYKDDVTIHFTASDSASGIDTVTADITITSEGENQSVTGTATDKAGNSASVTVTGISIDKTKPGLSFGGLNPAPNAAGWNNSDVTITYTTSDNLSGVASSVPVSPLSFTTNGANQTIAVTVTDKAGNSKTFDSPAVNLDKTMPVIVITAPQNKDYLTSESLTLNFTASDAPSGIASTTATLDGNPVTNGQVINLGGMAGNHTLSVVSIDKAGNTSSAAVAFKVIVASRVNMTPNTLNLKSQGSINAFTVRIEFPTGYDVAQIDVATVQINILGTLISAQLSPTSNGMVKFDRQPIINAIGNNTGDITFTITGKLKDGRSFTGYDTLKVINPGK